MKSLQQQIQALGAAGEPSRPTLAVQPQYDSEPAGQSRSDGRSWVPADGSIWARASVAPLPCSGSDDA
jgi:hypothetical protein